MAFDHDQFAAGVSAAAGIVCQLEADLNQATTGFVARDATLRALDFGVGSGRVMAGIDAARAAVAAGVDVLARTLLEPLFIEKMRQLVGKSFAIESDEFWDEIYAYDVANSKAVTSRNWTRYAVVAGGPENHTNKGGGTCYRLLLDEHNLALQGGDPGVIEVKCNGAAAVGGGARERWRTRWRAQYRATASDAIARYSSPRRVEPVEFDELWPDPGGIVGNPSFDAGSAGDLAAAPSPWEVVTGTITNHDLDGTVYFRQDGRATPLSLKIVGEDLRLKQQLAKLGKSLPRRVPLIRAIAYDRETGSYSGTLYLYTGAEATSVALSAQTGWNWLVSAMEDGCWWLGGQEQDNPLIEVFSDRTGGDLRVDTLIVKQMTHFDGTYLGVLGAAGAGSGGATPDDFQLDDVFTFTDSETAGGYIQKAIWYAFQRYVRHAGSPSGYTEPTLGTFA